MTGLVHRSKYCRFSKGRRGAIHFAPPPAWADKLEKQSYVALGSIFSTSYPNFTIAHSVIQTAMGHAIP